MLQMIRSRFWSTFSHFTDEELESGCIWIQENILLSKVINTSKRTTSGSGGRLQSAQINNHGDIQMMEEKQVEEEDWIVFEDRLLMIQGYTYQYKKTHMMITYLCPIHTHCSHLSLPQRHKTYCTTLNTAPSQH